MAEGDADAPGKVPPVGQPPSAASEQGTPYPPRKFVILHHTIAAELGEGALDDPPLKVLIVGEGKIDRFGGTGVDVELKALHWTADNKFSKNILELANGGENTVTKVGGATRGFEVAAEFNGGQRREGNKGCVAPRQERLVELVKHGTMVGADSVEGDSPVQSQAWRDIPARDSGLVGLLFGEDGRRSSTGGN